MQYSSDQFHLVSFHMIELTEVMIIDIQVAANVALKTKYSTLQLVPITTFYHFQKPDDLKSG